MDKKYVLMIILLLVAAVAAILIYQSQGLKRTYKSDVLRDLSRFKASENTILTESDIKHLPAPVQKYLTYIGAVGREKVQNFRAVFDGEFKLDINRDWVKIKAEQYNVIDSNLTRMFYITGSMSGIPIIGLHTYNNEQARMLIKLAGLITVADSKGPEARISDTTTLFNDMCFLAPATLIDDRIKWETADALTAKGTLDNSGCKVTAMLYFNEKGELVNFISDDRYCTAMDGASRKARWSTPISNYKEINGMKLPTYGEAIWHFPEGDFCYARFNVKESDFNIQSFK